MNIFLPPADRLDADYLLGPAGNREGDDAPGIAGITSGTGLPSMEASRQNVRGWVFDSQGGLMSFNKNAAPVRNPHGANMTGPLRDSGGFLVTDGDRFFIQEKAPEESAEKLDLN